MPLIIINFKKRTRLKVSADANGTPTVKHNQLKTTKYNFNPFLLLQFEELDFKGMEYARTKNPPIIEKLNNK